MEVLRTPDDRFIGLPDYPFAPHYLDVARGDGSGTLRVHYVDEGPADAAETVLLMHGEPSWSYLYRTMIPIITGAGYRAVAPDLVGFGRSDKPAERGDYTYQRHVDWMRAVLETIDLRNITLVCQDWGGLIGLRLAAEEEQRFARVVAANTFLPTGEKTNESFLRWRKFSQEVPDFSAGAIVSFGTVTDLSDDVVAAYDAPFPDNSFKEGARQFPMLVPITPDDPAAEPNRAAWKILEQWEKPFLTAFSDQDPIMSGGERVFQKRVPGTAGQAHPTITGGGHFLQEDRGPDLARAVVDFIRATPTTA